MTAGALTGTLVTREQRQVDPFPLQGLPDMLVPLVVGQGDRTRVPLALQLARRVLDVGLHQVLHRPADRHHRPGPLGKVVHEQIVTLLRVLPEVEDLGHHRDIFARSCESYGVHSALRIAGGNGTLYRVFSERRSCVGPGDPDQRVGLYLPDELVSSFRITSSMLKLAGFWRGGNSLKLEIHLPTKTCAGTSRKTRRACQST